jgi:hypothetical protein
MEYVVLQPADDGGELSLQLPAGKYDVEWFSLETREWTDSEPLIVDAAATKSIAPARRGAGVVHLKRSGA